MSESRKNLRKQCDRLWSEIIRSRIFCERCGKPANNPHHIIGRANYNLRWNIRNGCLLCAYCHVFGSHSAHNDPLGFMEWLKSNRPDDYEYLKWKRNEPVHRIDYEVTLIVLKEALREIKCSAGSKRS